MPKLCKFAIIFVEARFVLSVASVAAALQPGDDQK